MKPRMVGDTMNTMNNEYSVEREWQEQERRAVRSAAQFVGFILLALFTAQLVVSGIFVALSALNVLDLSQDGYGFDNTGERLFQMLLYVFYLAVPAVLTALIARRWDNPFASKRAPRGSYVVAIFGGMVISAFANVVASYVVSLLTNVGVAEPDFPSTIEPTLLSLALNVVATAVFPAIMEEMVFRGYILGALRPHGEKTAVLVSALLFGLIHGNILQVPFAAILGFVLGWLVIQTNSIWPAVVLHGVNNLFSVVMQWLEVKFPKTENLSIAVFMAFCVGGVIVFAVLFANKTRPHRDMLRPLANADSYLTVKQRVRTILTAPALIVGGIIWVLTLLLSMVSM